VVAVALREVVARGSGPLDVLHRKAVAGVEEVGVTTAGVVRALRRVRDSRLVPGRSVGTYGPVPRDRRPWLLGLARATLQVE
jgi:hypothetical protein